MPDWKHAPEGGNWGRFGPEDELGTLNYIGTAERKAAAAEIREGLAFCLSLPLDIPGTVSVHPRRKPPRLQPTYLGDTPYINYPLERTEPGLRDVLSDDQVLMSMQYSTQWDSLAHVGAMFDADGDGMPEPVYYNGFRAGVDVLGQTEGSPHGSYARHLSVAPMAATGVQGRGVLVDLLAAFGPDRTVVGLELLQQAMRDQGVTLRPGDILMLRTGYAEALLDMQDAPDPDGLSRYGAVLDGSDGALLDWIGTSRIAAISADNEAVEHMQKVSENCCFRLPLHHHCLFRLGLPLAELWYFRDLAAALAARRRHAVFLTAPPLRLPGAIGSPVTPVATI
ncbi:cyclase family protein [Agrobacterium genomosp. 3]|uniref:cyclase family protein n=1 Tax=Agrobacterium tomkonis TaxID=1183410 RepID=UPI001CD8DB4E|nr:cyclase family protein [Agrobacterium tomkonis]MCA1879314.1 cyclase family protein [Agrobacterium tumefaciens]MCA1894477.1 cyclase family protein [Agrobacterium tomkonis]